MLAGVKIAIDGGLDYALQPLHCTAIAIPQERPRREGLIDPLRVRRCRLVTVFDVTADDGGPGEGLSDVA